MIILKVVSLIILMQTVEILADCVFSKYDKIASPIFLEPFGKNHLIVDFGESVYISDGSYIEAFCPSNCFKYNKYYETEVLAKIVKINCNANVITCTTNDTSLGKWNDNWFLMCYSNKPRFYEYPVKYCNGTGFLYAHYIKSIPIVYAELCYNDDEMKIEFWHYVAAKRSRVLENQVVYNPTNLTIHLLEENTASLSNWKTKNGDPFIPLDIEMADFEYHNLLILPNYNEGFMTNDIDLVAWWMPLRTKNWRTLGKLISKEILLEDFDIYDGVSEEVTYPYGEQRNTNETKKLSDELGRTPPLYIWKYMKPKNSSDVGFIIIGINSPFVESSPNEMCDDICDSISWLQPMNKVRKMPAFGYVFCCKTDEIYQKLNGFPR